MSKTTIPTAGLADSAITTAKINADAITGAKIADDAINSEHYTDGSIDTAHIGDNQVTAAKATGVGGLALVGSSESSSSAAAVTFDSVFSSTYRAYKLITQHRNAAAGAQLRCSFLVAISTIFLHSHYLQLDF